MKRITLLLGLVFLAVCAIAQERSPSGPSLFGSLRARQIGPATMSGRITSIEVPHSKPEVVWVGTASGGVWKSVSGGVTFRPVFDEHNLSIGRIAVDQQHPDTVWVGTGEPWVRNSVSVGNGIYRTTNGGVDWKHMGLENSERISDIIIHPKDPNTVYVAVQGHLWNANEDRGVYKTTDGGATWQKVLYIDEDTGCADLAIDLQNPDILYAAMWSHRRYPYFFDSGFTGGSGLYKTTDGGKTWKTIHNGLPDEKLGRMAVAVAPSNSQVVYATVECKSKDKKGLYLSTDQGASWKKVSNEFNVIARPFYFSHMVVDPLNDSIVMKSGVQMVISEDRGERFRSMDNSVHSDVHDIWINPHNTKHLLIGTDGGVYESFDRGRTFRMFMNLPVSQFYHVSVDDDQPYNVYGGLQDNGSWYGPSQKAGGITNSDWKSTFGGDGFYSFRHPTRKNIIFSEYQGGNIVRYNTETGRAKDIKPYPVEDESKYRFNWNAPIHLSPTNPDRMYFGSQYLFMSEDMGDSWRRISPDLTTNDPEKLRQKESGGLSIDNSTAENHCTIYAIAESPLDGRIIWAGTDDGNLQVTQDGGRTWTNVAGNIPGLPKNTWVTFIDPGHFDKNVAYATFDGHRTGDMKTYVYKTTDLGKTWTSLATAYIEGYALSVREDLVNPELLFLGTEFGLFISTDGGASWSRFENNMPKVAVRDMVIHPRDHALVMGTHGRGVVILDDITPLRQISDEALAKSVHFFDTEPTVLRDPGEGGGWFGGSANFVGPNPPATAQIVYYMNRRHTFGRMYVEVWKDGNLLRTLPAGKSAGINMVEMPTSLEKPKAAPTNNRMALFGSLFGPSLPAGKYDVKLIKGKEEYASSFELVYDPKSPYTPADREIQRQTTMRLYDMTEQMAYIYRVLEEVEQKAGKLAAEQAAHEEALKSLAEKAVKEKGSLVALEGDFYVDEEERIRERISDLYRVVSGYPGRPSESQIKRTDKLEKDMKEVQARFDSFLMRELADVNKALAGAGVPTISYSTFQEFKEEKPTGGSASGGQLRVKSDFMYRAMISTPLGHGWVNGWMR
jgi:photosystem II stability/assembly factor-like uncharacterized protein